MPALDITPRVGPGRQLIERYGNGGFRVAGVRYQGSVLVFPERTLLWPVRRAEDIDAQSLADITAAAAEVQILMVGCGATFQAPPPDLSAALRGSKIALEWMDTGAACRTFNVLLIEGRSIAAALIAVD